MEADLLLPWMVHILFRRAQPLQSILTEQQLPTIKQLDMAEESMLSMIQQIPATTHIQHQQNSARVIYQTILRVMMEEVFI